MALEARLESRILRMFRVNSSGRVRARQVIRALLVTIWPVLLIMSANTSRREIANSALNVQMHMYCQMAGG